MIDYNLEKRRFVIGGVAIAIVVIYSIRLFMPWYGIRERMI